jgi:hypothetical protein
MGSWDDDYFFYMEDAAFEQRIKQSLKEISGDNAKFYLGIYGDAVETRVNGCIQNANEIRRLGYFAPAVVLAATALELLVRFMLVRPLVQGAFLSDEWAGILAGRIANGRSAEDRELLPAVLRQWGVNINEIKLKDGTVLGTTITTHVWPKRNKVVHQGASASDEEAAISVECAETLLFKVVTVVAKQLGFTLENTGKWSEVRGEESRPGETIAHRTWGESFGPQSPFDDA